MITPPNCVQPAKTAQHRTMEVAMWCIVRYGRCRPSSKTHHSSRYAKRAAWYAARAHGTRRRPAGSRAATSPWPPREAGKKGSVPRTQRPRAESSASSTIFQARARYRRSFARSAALASAESARPDGRFRRRSSAGPAALRKRSPAPYIASASGRAGARARRGGTSWSTRGWLQVAYTARGYAGRASSDSAWNSASGSCSMRLQARAAPARARGLRLR
mmetsp:Transcript_29534/g.78957  ORF Transcript_29534/g.78957 Transcript_29534/m.78957 type:complete len:218 (-) Transcript_29534:16-669(-)